MTEVASPLQRPRRSPSHRSPNHRKHDNNTAKTSSNSPPQRPAAPSSVAPGKARATTAVAATIQTETEAEDVEESRAAEGQVGKSGTGEELRREVDAEVGISLSTGGRQERAQRNGRRPEVAVVQGTGADFPVDLRGVGSREVVAVEAMGVVAGFARILIRWAVIIITSYILNSSVYRRPLLFWFADPGSDQRRSRSLYHIFDGVL